MCFFTTKRDAEVVHVIQPRKNLAPTSAIIYTKPALPMPQQQLQLAAVPPILIHQATLPVATTTSKVVMTPAGPARVSTTSVNSHSPRGSRTVITVAPPGYGQGQGHGHSRSPSGASIVSNIGGVTYTVERRSPRGSPRSSASRVLPGSGSPALVKAGSPSTSPKLIETRYEPGGQLSMAKRRSGSNRASRTDIPTIEHNVSGSGNPRASVLSVKSTKSARSGSGAVYHR